MAFRLRNQQKEKHESSSGGAGASSSSGGAAAMEVDGGGASSSSQMLAFSTSAAHTAVRKVKPAQLRLSTDFEDIEDMKESPEFQMDFPDTNDTMNFQLVFTPQEGVYVGGTFRFDVKIPDHYPHEPPKILCTTPVYHPNIDMDGKVCLNILRQDWKPVLTLKAVICGLLLLFHEPNPDDPLNKEAAEVMKRSPDEFRRNVANFIRRNR